MGTFSGCGSDRDSDSNTIERPPKYGVRFGNVAGLGSATTDKQLPTNYNRNRRTSVSAESLNPASASDSKWTPPSHPKTAEQWSRLQHAVAGKFPFSQLDDKQAAQVLGALQEKP